MRYAFIGKTGLLASKLAFGCFTLGGGPGALTAVQTVTDQTLADALVGRALDAGVNLFNTARAYAGSEAMLGAALGARRKDVLIATKIGLRFAGPSDLDLAAAISNGGLSSRAMIEGAEASLRDLGTDYVDVLLAHLPDTYTPLDETLAAFDALVRQGKARCVGFSNWPAWLCAKAAARQAACGYATVQAAEMYYSLACRDIEHEFVPFAQDAGIGVLVWSPLAGGYLTGRYSPEGTSAEGGRLTSFSLTPVDPAKGAGVLAALAKVAEKHGRPPATIALAWLLDRPTVASVLVGASSAAQLDDNLKAVEARLDAEDLAELDRASAPPTLYPQTMLALGGALDARVKAALDAAAPRRRTV